VALQKIAKRLKEENERLLLENASLKERVAQLEQSHLLNEDAGADKKRPRDESPRAHSQAKKRPKASAHVEPVAPLIQPPPPPQQSPPAMSPPSSSSLSPESPPTPLDEPVLLPTFETSFDMDTGIGSMIDFSSSIKVDSSYGFDCGFCSETTPCVCRDILNQLKPPDTYVDPSSLVSYDSSPSPLAMPDTPEHQESPSVLDNLPAYQPPVPLRKRTTKTVTKSLFPIYAVTSDSEGATCSGDPSNCGACGDDSFGKAFCSAIEEKVMARTAHDACSERCENCPGRQLDGSGSSGCCGDPLFCRGCPISPNPPPEDPASEFIPTNQAWRQIKAHPNAQFADLALLAEVVASRSKCSGPRIILGSSPEDEWPPASSHFDPSALNPPQLVPQEILLECGRRRVREVHSSGVRDALRLLDAKFT